MPCLYRIDSSQRKSCIPIILSGCSRFFDITTSALARAIHQGESYAYNKAPTSPYAKLSGNFYPNNTELSWLKNKNKCNQFVGDVLVASGYAVPTYNMSDGSEHYKTAEAFPKESSYFNKLSIKDGIKSGDIFVKDYGSRNGESGGHAEIIIAFDNKHNLLTLVGAHTDGAYLTEMTFNPNQWIYNIQDKSWSNGKDKIYFLRPKKKMIN